MRPARTPGYKLDVPLPIEIESVFPTIARKADIPRRGGGVTRFSGFVTNLSSRSPRPNCERISSIPGRRR